MSVAFFVSVSDGVGLNANEIADAIAKRINGGYGGNKKIAQGGSKEDCDLDVILTEVKELIETKIQGSK